MPSSAPQPAFRPPPYLIGLGILIIALGFGLPRLVTAFSHTEPPSASTSAEPVIDSATPKPASTHPETPNLWIGLARLAGGLVIVCGLCVAITRWMSGRSNATKGTMEVLASLAIDSRCGLHLVRAGDRRMLIGTDYSGVKALVELPVRNLGVSPDPLVEPPLPSTPVSDSSVVIGPVSVSVPSVKPKQPPSTDEILAMIDQLRSAMGTTARAKS